MLDGGGGMGESEWRPLRKEVGRSGMGRGPEGEGGFAGGVDEVLRRRGGADDEVEREGLRGVDALEGMAEG